LYRELGISKQAAYQSKQRQSNFDKELSMLVKQADILKMEHPGCGVEKMYYTLKPSTMGRDKFCEVFLSLGFGVKPIKNYQRTTVAGHINYPNLIEGMQLQQPFQVIQSDITYFDLHGKFFYLVFIIDVYTRQILGYNVSNHMRAEANLKALEMALKQMAFKPSELIHHSDRGSQYGSELYRQKLKEKEVHISMGLSATDNAYAERVNGIIKNEYLKKWNIKDERDLKRKVKKAVNHYNHGRKHRGHKMKFSPIEFFENWLNLDTKDRPLVNIFAIGREKNLNGVLHALEQCEQTTNMAHNCPMNIS
jgi:putative transposase